MNQAFPVADDAIEVMVMMFQQRYAETENEVLRRFMVSSVADDFPGLSVEEAERLISKEVKFRIENRCLVLGDCERSAMH